MNSSVQILCLVLAFVLLSMVGGTPVQAEVVDITFDPFDGMGGGEWEPGALAVGASVSAINAVYAPAYGIEFGEHGSDSGQGSLGECCDGNYFLNMGAASDGNLHWFVNAVAGNYFPAGSTISVSWNNNTGGASALKAYAGNISATLATVDNANDGSVFGGLVGEVTHGPEQYPTLELVLTADALSFTVHQSAFDYLNDSSFVTGLGAAPNVSINGLSFEIVEGLSGDLDRDGIVDGHDFLLWQRNFSYTTTTTTINWNGADEPFYMPTEEEATLTLEEVNSILAGAGIGLSVHSADESTWEMRDCCGGNRFLLGDQAYGPEGQEGPADFYANFLGDAATRVAMNVGYFTEPASATLTVFAEPITTGSEEELAGLTELASQTISIDGASQTNFNFNLDLPEAGQSFALEVFDTTNNLAINEIQWDSVSTGLSNWESQFGMSLSAATAQAVPEPSASVMTLLWVLLSLSKRRSG